ncbi:hypothetical protein V5O48_001096 [Marasmius crinis-equi]|uniref:Peptidase S28 n=1 Tax=Marasmius crinis-equi TaxID=585013 RepID=A0ABR3FZE6_9AGAR
MIPLLMFWLQFAALASVSICFEQVYPRVRDERPASTSTIWQQTDSSQPFFIDLPLDHFDPQTNATFNNRFWVNASYYEEGGPVFLFDSGEQDAEPLLPYYLQEYHGLSATMRLAERYKGIAILWEHRYYGASQPFPVNRQTTPEQWKYLTTEQALEDVVFFSNSFGKSAPNISTDNPLELPLHPSVAPWVMIGGSYPGVRAAHLRVRNPEVIYASWASSAPVHSQVDMASYYKAAERSLTRNCSADWVAVTRFVDDILTNNSTTKNDLKFKLWKARLMHPGNNATDANKLTEQQAVGRSDVSTASILMDPLNFYQNLHSVPKLILGKYYGFDASLLPFCNLLETRNFTATPLETGIAGTDGIESALDAFLVALGELDYDSIPGSPDDPVQDTSWMRQYCSEYGFYQRGDPQNPLSIETSLQSLQLFQTQCNDAFADHLPSWPQVDHVNKYGGWNMQPSNVMFTNGEFDPWRTMGLASIEPNSPHREPTVDVPACNEPPTGSSFFGMTYANMVHVSDLRVLLVPDENHTDFKTIGFYSPVSQEPFFTGLGLFQLALDEWLPCFSKS